MRIDLSIIVRGERMSSRKRHWHQGATHDCERRACGWVRKHIHLECLPMSGLKVTQTCEKKEEHEKLPAAEQQGDTTRLLADEPMQTTHMGAAASG